MKFVGHKMKFVGHKMKFVGHKMKFARTISYEPSGSGAACEASLIGLLMDSRLRLDCTPFVSFG